MSKNGILVSVAEDQAGKSPRIVTPTERFPVDNIMVDVARGKVAGARPDGSFGERLAAAGEVNRVIWPNGVFSLPAAAGVQMSIVSTSATDDVDAGTGIRTIEIHYLDADLNEGHEAIELQGLTPVLTVATDIRFIQCMHVQTYGDDPYANGTITASNGGIIYSQISAGDLRCTSSARMVPSGKYLYVAGAIGSSVSGTSAAKAKLRIVASELDAHQYIDPLIFIPFGTIGVQDASEAYSFPVPLKFSAGTVVAMTVSTDKDAEVSGSWFGWLEDI